MGPKTRDICLCGVFAALIAVGAFIKIPIPVCPITLQTLFVAMAGLILGSRRAALSVAVYIIVGLLGIPVFTQGGGIGYVTVPTFGYIIGFCAGAFVTGLIAERKEEPSFTRLFLASLAGLFFVYAFGLVYYYFISNYAAGNEPIGLYKLFVFCFLLTLPGDIVSCAAAALAARHAAPVIRRMSAR